MNIAEILKDCPKWTKLYSLVCGECTLYKVDNVGRITVFSTQEHYYNFFANGTMDNYGECLLFPSKENRDWSTFKVMPEFKKGDFVVSECGFIGILAEENIHYAKCKCALSTLNGFVIDNMMTCERLANEEEKQKLLKAIVENGYFWDEERLELRKKRKKFKLFPNKYYTAVANCFHDGICLLKIGHTYKGSEQEGCVVGEEGRLFIDMHDGIASTYLRHATLEEINGFEESRHKTHQFKPFDKVLVRDYEDENGIWCAALFSHYYEDGGYCASGIYWRQCIPYEGNEHLLGTSKNTK